ncbi:MAG: tetratricopeptide repeat protein [Cyclobacteriaceae bacterium]
MKKVFLKIALFLTFLTSTIAQETDSLEISLKSAEGKKRIDILHQLIITNWHNYPDKSMKYGEEALELSKAGGDSSTVSKSLRLIAGVYYYKADYQSSLEHNFKALDIAFALKDSTLINNGYNNIGLLYYDLGNYQTALEYLLRSIDIKKTRGETYGLSTTLNNIGLIFERASDFSEARKYFFEANKVSRSLNDLNVQVYSLNNVGITFRKEGNFSLARNYFDSALLMANEVGNINWGAVSLRNIGEILRYSGQYDSADYYLQKSLAACESIGERKGIAESLLFLAKLELDQGNINMATSYLDRSHELATFLKLRHQLLENLRLYASIHLVDQNSHEVIKNQLKYLDLQDSLFLDIVDRNLSMVPIKLKEEKDRIQLSRQQADLQSQGFINKLYAGILVSAIPVISILIFLLYKNRAAYAKLRDNNEELKKTQKLLITSEKMASLGVLAAGVGHEINNPLNYIKNGVNTLSATMNKKFKKEGKELEPYFNIINEGVDRASKIVKSLSHFSRAGLDANEYCSVEDILENCQLILGNKLRSIEVIKSYSRNKAVVNGNEGKLHQAFMNVLTNAIQAITENGKIWINTEVNNGKMIVSVRDNGAGISEENLLKISDPFFTTKSPGEGTGLGLFITYAIIEEHNGDIQVISTPATGTELIITLPLYQKTNG